MDNSFSSINNYRVSNTLKLIVEKERNGGGQNMSSDYMEGGSGGVRGE
jgi:hypothetical protein